MERKISLFVSKKNALTWIAAILVFLSAVARILLCAFGLFVTERPWPELVLPVAAAFLYILIALIWSIAALIQTLMRESKQ